MWWRPVRLRHLPLRRRHCRPGQQTHIFSDFNLEPILSATNAPALRAELAAHGREFVRTNFAVEQMIDRLHQLYLKLATESKTGQGERGRAGND